MITSLRSLLPCAATSLVASAAFSPSSKFTSVQCWSSSSNFTSQHQQQRHLRIPSAAPAANNGNIPSVPEQYDLLPPDTGIVRIDGYDSSGFIVGDVQVEGSILCSGDLWLSWRATSLADLSIESIGLVDLVKPLPELLVVGCGSEIGQLPDSLFKELKERDIFVEALDTVSAVATFNILNQEGRKVVGALLPAGV